jgi:hypothetical protein
VRFGEVEEFVLLERPVPELPGILAALFEDEAALDAVLAGEPGQFVGREGRVEVRKGVPNDKGLRDDRARRRRRRGSDRRAA